MPSASSVCSVQNEGSCKDVEICTWNENLSECMIYTPPIMIDREYDFYGYINEINEDFGFRKTTDCNDNYRKDKEEEVIFSNFDKYWWVILFWLPALFSRYKPVKKRKYFPWFFLGMIMYILSFIIWAQGKPNSSYCNPDSFIQLHAIWHLMTAFSTWCFFKFFRTEKLINSE